MTLRTRTRDDTGTPAFPWTKTLCNGTSTSGDKAFEVSPVGYGIIAGSKQTTTDVVTANFQSRKAKGEIINNPFRSFKTEYSGAIGTWEYKRSSSCSCSGTTQKRYQATSYSGGLTNLDQSLTDNLPLKTDAFSSEVAQLSANIQTRALAGIVPAEMEGLVDMLEWKKTFKLVRHPLSGIQDYLKKVRRSKRYKRSTAVDLGQYLSNEWLRYRYGLMPLTYALQGALNASLAPRLSNRVTARSSGTTSSHDLTKSVGNSHWLWNATHNYTGSIVSEVRAGILYDHEFTKNDLYGTSMSQIPAAIWEIIPFSFVVDWFANVEEFIRAVTPKADVRRLAEWTTVKTTATRHLASTFVSSNPSCQDIVTLPSGYYQRVEIEKTRQPGVNAQLSSKLKSIHFEAPKDWLHLADGIALIRSSLGYR